MKKGCGIAAALLLEGLSLCADRLPRRVVRPAKLFTQAFVSCRQIVKSQNGRRRKMFLFFPPCSGPSFADMSNDLRDIAVFSRTFGLPWGTNAVATDWVGGRCRPSPMHCPADGDADPSTEPLPPGAAGSVVGDRSIHPDFHCDPDQVGMVLGP
jgi:hypothetical protein